MCFIVIVYTNSLNHAYYITECKGGDPGLQNKHSITIGNGSINNRGNSSLYRQQLDNMMQRCFTERNFRLGGKPVIHPERTIPIRNTMIAGI